MFKINAHSNEAFDEVLSKLVQNEPHLLSISGVYEAVSEHFNNAILEELGELVEGTSYIFGHTVDWYFKGEAEIDDEQASNMEKNAVEHIEAMIAEGYTSGELVYNGDDDDEYRGWWSRH